MSDSTHPADARLVCVRHSRLDSLGSAERLLSEAGMELVYEGSVDGGTYSDVGSIAGLIVLGGSMNVDEIDRFPFLLEERELVASAMDRRVPLLGICLGAQMVARALGARVHRSATNRIGFSDVIPTAHAADDPLFGEFPPVGVFSWHRDVFDVPDGAVPLLESSDGMVQAFRSGTSTWAIQPHVEVSTTQYVSWLEHFSEEFPEWGTTEAELASLAPNIEPQEAAYLRTVRSFADIVLSRVAGGVAAEGGAT